LKVLRETKEREGRRKVSIVSKQVTMTHTASSSSRKRTTNQWADEIARRALAEQAPTIL